ncbi:hypothetical protein G4B88_019097 [Cannabis sativa]|uniref:Protein FAR1-RELATED SEQUENCE n=1 Tax=Cannabis sativa TaxID=3483 RepID=A0A7J6H1E7_CANSA|nr:hypothetical protein G4B88_019097 [Cannabis sativa]
MIRQKIFRKKATIVWMFLRHCDNGVAALRYNEMAENYKTNMSDPCPKLTSMPNIEEQAASIFTRKVFNLVKGEIKREDRYSCSKSEIVPNYDLFLISKYMSNHPKCKVFISHDEEDIKCDCYWFETRGIPCRHIFASMKHSNKGNFPPCLINSRWVKDVKDIDPKSVGKERRCPHPNAIQNTRYGRINTQASLVSYYATKSQRAFAKAMTVMSTLVEDLQIMTNNEDDDDGMKIFGLQFKLTIQKYKQIRVGQRNCNPPKDCLLKVVVK